MKKLLLSAVVLFMGMLGVQAQDRSAYSFKVTPHVNQEDELNRKDREIAHLQKTLELLKGKKKDSKSEEKKSTKRVRSK